MRQTALNGQSDERGIARLALHLDASLKDDEEKWITVNGAHIQVGEGGEPKSGPPALKKALEEKRENPTSNSENTPKSAAPSQNRLQNVAKSCTMKSSDGVQIKGYSSHVLDQMEARGFDEAGVEDAIKNPLHITPDKLDEFGQPSRQYIGRKATVAVNPETGVICTGWRTSRQRRKKYGGE